MSEKSPPPAHGAKHATLILPPTTLSRRHSYPAKLGAFPPKPQGHIYIPTKDGWIIAAGMSPTRGVPVDAVRRSRRDTVANMAPPSPAGSGHSKLKCRANDGRIRKKLSDMSIESAASFSSGGTQSTVKSGFYYKNYPASDHEMFESDSDDDEHADDKADTGAVANKESKKKYIRCTVM